MPTSAGSAFRSQNRLLDFLLERQRAAKVLAPHHAIPLLTHASYCTAIMFIGFKVFRVAR